MATTSSGKRSSCSSRRRITTYDSGIVVENKPPESQLIELGIKSWPKWGCPAGKYTLRYEAEQTCYYLRGKVRLNPLTPKGEGDAVEFGAGDLVTIPKGLRCTIHVSSPIDKHYTFAPN